MYPFSADKNSVTLSKDSDFILSLILSFCNNSTCCFICIACTVPCPVTFSHIRGSVLSGALYQGLYPLCSTGFKFLAISSKILRKINHFVGNFGKFVLVGGFSNSDGIGVKNNDSVLTTAITLAVFIAKITDRFAKNTRIWTVSTSQVKQTLHLWK